MDRLGRDCGGWPRRGGPSNIQYSMGVSEVLCPPLLDLPAWAMVTQTPVIITCGVVNVAWLSALGV